MDYVEHRMNEQAAQAPASDGLITPLNVILISIVAYTAYLLFRPTSRPELPRAPPPVVFKTYTPHTLLPFNGEQGAPIFFAVRGQVFDVSRGRNFYGPGGPYSNFAGRDASRGLANGSFDEDMLTLDLDGPLYDLAKLGPEEEESLRGWEERFTEKYDIVGKFVSVEDHKKETKA